jgi:hypothetical protein
MEGNGYVDTQLPARRELFATSAYGQTVLEDLATAA